VHKQHFPYSVDAVARAASALARCLFASTITLLLQVQVLTALSVVASRRIDVLSIELSEMRARARVCFRLCALRVWACVRAWGL